MTTAAVLDAFEALLNTVAVQTLSDGSPRFNQVVIGDPRGLPATDRVVATWWNSDSPAYQGIGETMGNAMVREAFHCGLYWLPRTDTTSVRALEIEKLDGNRAVKAALRGSSTLGGLITDLKLGDSQYGVTDFRDGTPYVTVRFDVEFMNLEAEAIHA